MFTSAIDQILNLIVEHEWWEPEDEGPISEIQSLGYKLVGVGYYSSVWVIPGNPNLVLKISHREEDPAREYMAWCRENPHPAAPKIISYEEKSGFVIVTMPRYAKLEYDYDTRPATEEVLLFEREPDWDKPEEELAATIRDLFPYHRVDLHWSNIMLDKTTGQLILTDPFSEG